MGSCTASFDSCHACDMAKAVKNDLMKAGLVSNVEKSHWTPVQCLDWLILRGDSSVACMKITQRRMKDLESCIDSFQAELPEVLARKIAVLAGKINSLYPLFGNVTQLKTRIMHHEIIRREHWDKTFLIKSDNNLISEHFSGRGIYILNVHIVSGYYVRQIIFYSDAMSVRLRSLG